MKKLSTFHLWEGPQAAMYQDMLAREGIECVVKNDRLTAAIGEIPFVECFPELWVIDDEMYPRARLLFNGWVKKQLNEEGESWNCSECGEMSEQHFSVCWNCSHPRE